MSGKEVEENASVEGVALRPTQIDMKVGDKHARGVSLNQAAALQKVPAAFADICQEECGKVRDGAKCKLVRKQRSFGLVRVAMVRL
eukprot:6195742-Pleurochrysis_carterae.AAC.2